MTDKLKKINFLIIILGVLLALSLAALAFVYISGKGASAIAPDNYISPQAEGSASSSAPAFFSNLSATAPLKTIITSSRAKETVLTIYKNHASDSVPFNSPNLFPGDSESQEYLVEISHRGTVTVRFRADIREGYDKLAEVLKCRVGIKGEANALYDGLMRDMPESLNHRISSIFKKTTDLSYTVTVYLDTSVGNEYMNKGLVADFIWWVEASGEDPAPITTAKPETTEEPIVTDEPTDTEEPIVTDEPTDTAEPVVTDEPTDTVEPVVTDEPIITDDTTSPEETTTDSEDTGELVNPPTGDSFRSLLWLLLLLAAVVVSRMVSKKARREYSKEGE